MMYMILEIIQAKLKERGADHEMIHQVQEKLNSLLLMLENLGSSSMAWLAKLFPPETRNFEGMCGQMMSMIQTTQAKLKEMGADEMIHILVEKLKKLLSISENFGLFFPPETIKERIQQWIHVGAPYAVSVFVFLLLFWYCSNKGGYSGKMMKAPGRDFKMRRSDFAANPKGYFRDLHASKHKK